MGGYGIVLASVGILLWFTTATPLRGLFIGLRQLWRGGGGSRNLALVFVLASGLPPFFFFFLKLGVLSTLLQQGGVIKLLLALSLFCFSWFVYFWGVRYLTLVEGFTGFTRLTRRVRFTSQAGLGSCLVICLCGLGVFWLDDMALIAW